MATCFLCGTEMVPRFVARDHLRPSSLTEYRVDWCEPCGFGRVDGSFRGADVAEFYKADDALGLVRASSASMRMLDRLRVHVARWADRGVALSTAEIEPPQPVPTLCDLGCGSGQAMIKFKKAGYDVLGIEPDPAAGALAAAIGPVYAGTAEELPEELTGKDFDVVLLSHVLELCTDPVAALRNVKRLLSPQGTAVIEVPNNAAEGFQMYGPGWFFADIPRHLQFFTEGSLRKAMRLVGLLVTKVMYTGYTRQFSNEWLAAQRAICTHAGLDEALDGNILQLLATTAFALPSRKYDSLRIHAIHLN